jgi:hypothetical protein
LNKNEIITNSSYKFSISNATFHFNYSREQIKELALTDISGRNILFRRESFEELNISFLTSGLYFYSVQTKSGKLFNGKLIRQ